MYFKKIDFKLDLVGSLKKIDLKNKHFITLKFY